MYKLKVYMIDLDKPGSAQTAFVSPKTINPTMYKLVFESMEETSLIDQLFSNIYRSKRLESQKVQNLSISDIVCFEDMDGTQEWCVKTDQGWIPMTINMIEFDK